MTWKSEWKYLLWIVAGFLACFYLPVGNARFDHTVREAFYLVKEYAQEHVFLCLMVTSNWDISEGGRPKRLFTITDEGKQCLKHWNDTLHNYHTTIKSLLKTTQKAIR